MAASLKTAGTASSTLQEQFERNGFMHIPGAVSPERVQHLRSYLINEFQDAMAKPDTPGVLLGDPESKTMPRYRCLLMNAYARYPELAECLCNEPVVEGLRAVLGEQFVLLPENAAHWDYNNNLHTDTTTLEDKGHQFHQAPDFRMVTCAIYLQDNTPTNGGGLSVVPGSHRLPDPFVRLRNEMRAVKKSRLKRTLQSLSGGRLYDFDRALRNDSRLIDIPSKKGDVIIFDMRLIHRSTYPKPGASLPPESGKIAIFATLSANNQHVQNYLDWLLSNGSHFNYLQEDRSQSEIAMRAMEFGFQIR